jgi:hypothetical protein
MAPREVALTPTYCSVLAADEPAVNVFTLTKPRDLIIDQSPSRPKDLLSTKYSDKWLPTPSLSSG